MLKAAVSRLPKTTLDTGLMRGTNMLQSPQRQTVYRGTRSGAYDQSQAPSNLSTISHTSPARDAPTPPRRVLDCQPIPHARLIGRS